jgi:NAD dependent epimerase/dehydratase
MSVAERRVLVTGAGGFVGSHLVEALVAGGASVRALVHYNARNDWGNLELLPAAVLRELEVVLGDIQDPFGVARAAEDRDLVFHLAALIGIPYSYVAPQSYVSTNVTGTLNVLEAVRATGARLVHTSTSEAYGTARYTPIDEEHPLQGQSPYSASKIGADKLVESYARSFEVDVVTLRPFNTYGPRQSLRAMIPTILGQALAGKREIRLGSLDPVRDLTFVEDTVAAFVAVAMADGLGGRVLNAGTGKGISVGELARLALGLVGSDAEIVLDQARVRPPASEVGELLADSSALRAATGWQPQVELRDGLARTADWVREHLARLKHDLYVV